MNNNPNTADKDKKISEAMRLKFWKLNRGAHKLKNRSSKHLRYFAFRYIYRCFNNDMLKKLSACNDFDATQELARRDRRRDKTEARKAKYLAKLEAKRASK